MRMLCFYAVVRPLSAKKRFPMWPELAVLEVGCPSMRVLPMPLVEPRLRPTAVALNWGLFWVLAPTGPVFLLLEVDFLYWLFGLVAPSMFWIARLLLNFAMRFSSSPPF